MDRASVDVPSARSGPAWQIVRYPPVAIASSRAQASAVQPQTPPSTPTTMFGCGRVAARATPWAVLWMFGHDSMPLTPSAVTATDVSSRADVRRGGADGPAALAVRPRALMSRCGHEPAWRGLPRRRRRNAGRAVIARIAAPAR
jgi:hypothetical protein